MRGVLASAALAAGLFMSTAAGAAEGRVAIELNKLEPVAKACRAYLVLENATGHGFDSFKLDLVMFDQENVIAKRLAVQAGPLPADKTSVKLFDIDGLRCEAIGRFLLNSVMACESEAAETPDCTALAEPSSRAAPSFIK